MDAEGSLAHYFYADPHIYCLNEDSAITTFKICFTNGQNTVYYGATHGDCITEIVSQKWLRMSDEPEPIPLLPPT